MLAALGLLVAAAAATATGPHPSHRPRVHLVVDVERDVTLTGEDVSALTEVVRTIWKPVLDVSVSRPGSPVMGTTGDTLRLVVTNRRLEASENGLAWIEFVDGEPKSELTVSMGAVNRMLAKGEWRGRPLASLPPRVSRLFVQRAMGLAVAHEMGHYLLRSRTHDRKGLMQAMFTVDEIMDGRAKLGSAASAYAMRVAAQDTLAWNRDPIDTAASDH